MTLFGGWPHSSQCNFSLVASLKKYLGLVSHRKLRLELKRARSKTQAGFANVVKSDQQSGEHLSLVSRKRRRVAVEPMSLFRQKQSVIGSNLKEVINVISVLGWDNKWASDKWPTLAVQSRETTTKSVVHNFKWPLEIAVECVFGCWRWNREQNQRTNIGILVDCCWQVHKRPTELRANYCWLDSIPVVHFRVSSSRRLRHQDEQKHCKPDHLTRED